MKKVAPSKPLSLLSSASGVSVEPQATGGSSPRSGSAIVHLDGNKLKAVPEDLVARWATDENAAASVRVLELRNNHLRTLPAEIGNLKNLEALHLDNNHLIAWPREIGNLGKLKVLTFEGNDSLKELPPPHCFPELKSMRVTRRVNYRIPADVVAGGGETIIDYLRALRALLEQLNSGKLVVSFDPKAHLVLDKEAPGFYRLLLRVASTDERYVQYHCNLCGNCFCFKDLSPQKMSIPYLSPSPAEVCLDCFNCLSAAADAFASPSKNVRRRRNNSPAKTASSPRGRKSGALSDTRTMDRVDDDKESDGGELVEVDDDEEMDPRKLLEKWKIESLSKLRQETKRGIESMKHDLTQQKEKELGELRKEIEVLRKQLVTEKSNKERNKQRETVEREVQLQTELAKRKDEVVNLQERLTKSNKAMEQLRSKLKVLRESTIAPEDAQAKIESLQAECESERARLEQETKRNAELQEKLEQAHQARAEIEKQLTAVSESMRETSSKLEEEVKLKQEALNKIPSLEKEIRTLRQEAKHQARVEESTQQLIAELRDRQQQLESELADERMRSASDEDKLKVQLAELTATLQKTKKESEGRASVIASLQTEREELQKLGQGSENERISQAITQLGAEKALSSELQSKLDTLGRYLEKVKAEETLTRNGLLSELDARLAEKHKYETAARQLQTTVEEKALEEQRLRAALETEEKKAREAETRLIELQQELAEMKRNHGGTTELEDSIRALNEHLKQAQSEAQSKDNLITELQQKLETLSTERSDSLPLEDVTPSEIHETETSRGEPLRAQKEADEAIADRADVAELQQKVTNMEVLLEAMRDEVRRAQEAEEEADKAKEGLHLECQMVKEQLKAKENLLRRTRHKMNNRMSQLILGMEEGEGLEALRQQLEEKEKEFEEIKAKAAEETQKQIESVMKLVEDKGKEIKKMKKQLKEAKKKNKTQEVELEKALAKVLLYEEQHQYDKHGTFSKEKMSLISKIEQLKAHELQLMEELSTLQARKRATSFSGLPLPLIHTKNKLLGSLSSMPAEDSEQLKKEKKELKEKEKKEREEKEKEKKERKRREKEERKLEGKEPKTPRESASKYRGLRKSEKKLPKNPVFGVSLEELQQKDSSRTIPRIVERLVDYLEQHGVYETEGIFRKSGRNLTIDALRKEFDLAGQGKEDEVALEDDENVGIHEVAGVVKLFLQMLPEPILSFELYPSFIALQDTFESLRREKSEEETEECHQEYISSLVTLLKQLPTANIELLFFILRFCNKLSKAAEQTKMTSHNLSLIFSPSLCSPEVPDISYQTQMPKLGSMVKTMIDEVQTIETVVRATMS